MLVPLLASAFCVFTYHASLVLTWFVKQRLTAFVYCVVSSMVKKIKTKIHQCFHFSVFSSHTFTEYFSTQFCISVK